MRASLLAIVAVSVLLTAVACRYDLSSPRIADQNTATTRDELAKGVGAE